MTPREEAVTRHGQTVLLLLQVKISFVNPAGRSVAESVVSLRFVVDIWVSLDEVVWYGDSYALRDVEAVEVDSVWGSHLMLS